MNTVRNMLIVALTLGICVVAEHLLSAKEGRAPDNGEHAHDHDEMAIENRITKSLADVSPDDLELVAAQRFCPVHPYRRLGAQGTPVKVETTSKPFFVCNQDCVEDAQKSGAKSRRIANGLKKSTARLSKMPPEQRAMAELQKYCPVMSNRLLGTMGAPIRIELDGEAIYVCCHECVAEAEANPKEILARAERLKLQKPVKRRGGHHH